MLKRFKSRKSKFYDVSDYLFAELQSQTTREATQAPGILDLALAAISIVTAISVHGSPWLCIFRCLLDASVLTPSMGNCFANLFLYEIKCDGLIGRSGLILMSAKGEEISLLLACLRR